MQSNRLLDKKLSSAEHDDSLLGDSSIRDFIGPLRTSSTFEMRNKRVYSQPKMNVRLLHPQVYNIIGTSKRKIVFPSPS